MGTALEAVAFEMDAPFLETQVFTGGGSRGQRLLGGAGSEAASLALVDDRSLVDEGQRFFALQGGR